MKTILFYGDSLTYGKVPKYPKRYEREKNFIGVIESELGIDYRIIDEGLRARTVVGENNFFPERDGLVQFGPILGSHLPLDLVCIFLGTNDCNKKDTKNDKKILEGLLGYKEKVLGWCKNLAIDNVPQILIIAPPIIRGDQVFLDENMKMIFDMDGEEKSKSLKTIYKYFCEQENCIFFDSGDFCITADNEGIHLDEANNISLGEALAKKIKSIL